MSTPRGATPTLTLTFTEPDLDLTQAVNVYVTFSDGRNTFTKTGDSLTVGVKQIDVRLEQSDTLGLSTGRIRVQANWTYAGGRRMASNISVYELTQQLLNEVVG